VTKQEYVDSIREEYTGLRDLPRDSLASSIKTLADDLYSRDTHFIFELIQNAEDNEYSSSVPPRLAFEICLQEIEGKSGPVLIVHNNETGFEEKHVRALCQVGKSTKQKAQGYIGEKGIGFKSVFRVTTCPYIFSNGFQFCLPEHDSETGLGYIVPRWVPVQDVQTPSGETTIVLPMDKDEESGRIVTNALRDIAPETILFLTKLKAIQVSVRLPGDEHEVEVEKHVRLEAGPSRLVELTYLRRSDEAEPILESSLYWLTEIEFPKPPTIQHQKRPNIESRSVSVAIPLGSSAGKDKLFAYLPVWDDTELPFLINADFLLVSSREGVREDEAWNKWLRDCVIETYCTSLLSLLNCPELSLAEKIAAYASVPRSTHRAFLTPVIQPVQKRLKGEKCVIVLPDDSLVAPHQARLCYENFRTILGLPEHFPSYLHNQAWLVRAEMEAYNAQLEAIGVNRILLSELVSCLEDSAWVKDHDILWFVDLFGYLKSQKFQPNALLKLRIVPIFDEVSQQLRLSCDQELPIYFSRSEADVAALARVPEWLSRLVPIAFLPSALLQGIDAEDDSDELRKWMTEALRVYDFSVENYCVDIKSKLESSYGTLTSEELVPHH